MLRKSPRLKRSKLFIRYILSYSLVLIIPVFVMGLFIYTQFIQSYKSEVQSNQDGILLSVGERIDSQISQIHQILYQIEASNIVPEAIQEPSRYIDVINMLHNFNMTNEFIYEIVLHEIGSDYVYTSSYSSKIKYFVNHFFNFKNWTEDNFRNDLEHCTSPIWRPMEVMENDISSLRNLIAAIYPSKFNISVNPVKNRFSLLFFIDTSELFKMTIPLQYTKSGNFFIIDRLGNILFSLNDCFIDAPLFNNKYSFNNNVLKSGIDYNGKHLSINSVPSEYRMWTYVTVIPTNDVLIKSRNIIYMFMIAIILLFIIGSVIIYITVMWSYQPIQRLSTLLTDVSIDLPKSEDELTAVAKVITELNSKLLNSLRKTRGPMIRSLLLKLLYGQFKSTTDFNEEGCEYGFSLTGSWYRVLFLRPSYDHFCKASGDLVQNAGAFLHALLKECFEILELEDFDNNGIVFILSSPVQMENQLHRILINAESTLVDSIGSKTTIFVGNAYYGIENIHASYLGVSIMAKYQFSQDVTHIIFYRSFMIQNTFFNYPNSEMEMLALSLQKCDIEKVQLVFKKLYSIIHHSSNNMQILMCLCYDVLNCIQKNILMFDEEIKITMNENFESLMKSPLKCQEDVINKLHHLEELIHKCFSNIQISSRNPSDFTDQVLSYIQKNYLDPCFSFQTLADQMEMSLSALSQKYKLATG